MNVHRRFEIINWLLNHFYPLLVFIEILECSEQKISQNVICKIRFVYAFFKCRSHNFIEKPKDCKLWIALELFYPIIIELLKILVITFPATWALNTWPWGLISRLTYSRTSRKSSLRRYLIPSRRQPICPVTWDVIWACSSLVADLTPCWVMKVLRTPVSQFWGYPKSRISEDVGKNHD